MLEGLYFSSFESDVECTEGGTSHFVIIRSKWGDMNLTQAKDLAMKHNCRKCCKYIRDQQKNFMGRVGGLQDEEGNL